MHHRNYDVFITIDGKKVPEYQVRVVDEKTIECFIPSESGKEFTICWKSGLPTHSSVRCSVDGINAGSTHSAPLKEGLRWGVRTSPTTRLPYRFADLKLLDDDDLPVEGPSIQNLGTIEATIFRVVLANKSAEKRSSYSAPPKNIGAVHERSKKAGAHCVEFGPPKIVPAHPHSNTRPLNPSEGHYVKFIFRYRPRALLQAQGIIVPGSSQDTTDSVKPEKKQPSSSKKSTELKRKRGAQDEPEQDVKPNLSSLKRHEGASPRPAKRVKQEPRRTPVSQPDNVIDLTSVKQEDRSAIIVPPSVHGTHIDLTLDDD
ncbi:hypothetical protein K474DRAFT_1621341 [Panus rudis PR-1116 ss-1]|nr:hypothetical protein K474DRAFT_1621341 [Panus rudis PR-1116 ss-1]